MNPQTPSKIQSLKWLELVAEILSDAKNQCRGCMCCEPHMRGVTNAYRLLKMVEEKIR